MTSEFNSPSSSSSHPSDNDDIPKPNFTYSSLIFMAIRSSEETCLTPGGICRWIEENYPYYRNANTNWKINLRQRLSTDDFFIKIANVIDGPESKYYWTFDQLAKDVTIDETNGRLINKPTYTLADVANRKKPMIFTTMEEFRNALQQNRQAILNPQ